MVAPLQLFKQVSSTGLHIGAGLGTGMCALTTLELARRLTEMVTDKLPEMPERIKNFKDSADNATGKVISRGAHNAHQAIFPYQDKQVHSTGEVAMTAGTAFVVSLAVFELARRYAGQPFPFINNVSPLQFRGDSLVGKAIGFVRG